MERRTVVHRKMHKLRQKIKGPARLAAIILAVAAIIAWTIIDKGDGRFITEIPVALICFAAAIPVHIVLHEAGHMAAGLANGWKFVSFMVFGISVVSDGRRLKICRQVIEGAGGQCLMMPPDRPAEQCGVIAYNAGGVAANFIISALSLAILVAFYGNIGLALTSLLSSLCVSGIFLGLANGIPAKPGNIANDAMNIRLLKEDPVTLECMVSSLRINALQQQEIRLKDMPESIFIHYSRLSPDNSIQLTGLLADAARAIDCHDFALADDILKKALSRKWSMHRIYRMELESEDLFVSLMLRKEDRTIKRKLNGPLKRYIEDNGRLPGSLRIQYALARLYERDETKAKEILRRFDESVSSNRSTAESASESSLVGAVRDVDLGPVETDAVTSVGQTAGTGQGS